MAGKDERLSRRDGALRVVSALGYYGAYFDHPGWFEGAKSH